MQIVIDISDETYEYISDGSETSIHESNVVTAVRNGTPLPKGHGDLIDRSRLEADYCTFDYKKPEFVGYSVGLIENAEVIIPADKEGD